MNIYDFKAVASNGKEIDLRQFKCKVLLIANTAGNFILLVFAAIAFAACHNADKAPLPEKDSVAVTDVKPDDNSDFVAITDVVPDAILEIRYYSTYNFVGTRIDGYEQPIALMTKQAADSLKAVSDELREQGYRIKIWDSYRPQTAVDHFVRWAEDLPDTTMKHIFYPMVDKSLLFEQQYIMARSGHSRGSTIDLTLVDEQTGKELDMGSPFDWFGYESHPDYTKLTKDQIANRHILWDAMFRHGFKGIDSEWWHFTLKNEPYPDTYFSFPVRQQ